MDDNQLFFDFSIVNKTKCDGENSIKEDNANFDETILSNKEIIRASLGWLLQKQPHGIGVKVPTKITRYTTNIAAFWASSKKNYFKPSRTMVIECRATRDECLAEVIENKHLLPELHKLKKRRYELQQFIIKTEPELKEKDFLFNEFQSWDFNNSKNKEYHKCCRMIDKVERAVYNGSRFEKIRSAYVADQLYLAVPKGTLEPFEVADGWGLIYINDDKSVEVAKKAENWNCPEENRLHLIQNIAGANTRDTLFSNGIYQKNAESEVIFTKVPRRKKTPEKK